MGIYKNIAGEPIEVDDAQALAERLEPYTLADKTSLAGQQQRADRGKERGFVGEVNALATGVVSGVTMGGSDWLLSDMLDEGQRERLNLDIETNPGLRGTGEIVGAVGAAVLGAPGTLLAKSPTAALSNLAATQLGGKGVVSAARAVGAMGVEGALQNAGQYLGRTALADKEITAEGFTGALSTGGKFGMIGGGAALAVTKGAMTARKMYSKLMDGGKDAGVAAESAWTRESQQLLDANEETLRAAERELADLQQVRQGASIDKQRAMAALRQEQVYAGRAPRAEIPDIPPMAARADDVAAPPAGVADEAVPSGGSLLTREEAEGLPGPAVDVGAKTQVLPPEGLASPSKLERQLAGTQEELAAGKKLKDITPEAEADFLSDMPPEARSALRFSTFGEKMPWEHSADPFVKKMAAREAELSEAVQEMKAAREATKDLYIDPKKLWALDPDQVMAHMKAGGDLDEFIAKQPLDTGPFAKEIPGAEISLDDLKAMYGKTLEGEPLRKGKKAVIDTLEEAHDEALERAAKAASPAEANAAVAEAGQIEKRLEMLAPDEGVANIGQHAEALTAFEKANAKLVDVVGDAAHPRSVAAAEAFRKADDEAMQLAMERHARAIDDHEMFGPKAASPKERVDYARARKGEADSALANAKLAEMEAKARFGAAKASNKALNAEKASVLDGILQPAPAGKSDKLVNLGAASEFLDLPGMPKVSDLPVIGPMLGLYLKYRGVKNLLSRAGGKIPATADNKVAAMAAKTRERIGVAVERMLGVTEKVGKAGQKYIPTTAGILANRLYDDGEPDSPKGASVQTLAATRLRELAAYATSPNAIENDVRKEMQNVTDPSIISAVEKHRRAMFQHLLDKAPKLPPQNPLNKRTIEPTVGQASVFANRLEAAMDPVSVFERIRHERQMITLEAAETMRFVYPKLYETAQKFLMYKVAEMKNGVGYQTRAKMSLLFDIPLDNSLEPANMRVLQSAFKPTPPPAQPPQGGPPFPGVAAPTNVNSMYLNPLDK